LEYSPLPAFGHPLQEGREGKWNLFLPTWWRRKYKSFSPPLLGKELKTSLFLEKKMT
jgi:hypothetical protein